MKRCSHDRCGRRIQPDNKSGMCMVHYNEQRARDALPSIVCEHCGQNAIHAGSKTGLCITCYNAKRRSGRPTNCADCGAPIGKSNKTGRCAGCYTAFLYPAGRRCQHDGCNARIGQYVKSGLCGEHRWKVRKPVLNERTMILVRKVGAELGVHPRDILNGYRMAGIVEARAVVATILRQRGLSYPRIGERLGRDHSSVINLIKQMPRYLERNPRLAGVMERAA